MALSPENQKARRGIITASAFAALAAGGASRASVVARLVGEIRKGEFAPSEPTAAMQHGIDNERNVITAFANDFYGEDPGAVAYNDHLYQPDANPMGIGATPDALIYEEAPVEVKSPATADSYQRQIHAPPDKYKQQVKFQIFVLEECLAKTIGRGNLVFGHPDDKTVITAFSIDLTDEDRLYIRGVCASVRREINEALARPTAAVSTATTLTAAIKEAADAGAEINAIEAAYKAACADLAARRDTLLAAAEERRQPALTFVQASLADTPKHERPQGVVFRTTSKVQVDNVDDLPPDYVKVTKSADKRKLGAALRDGEIVPGAALIETDEVSVPASRITVAEVITDQFKLTNKGANQ